MVEHYDKATNKYIDIYKDSLKNHPHKIVELCQETIMIDDKPETAIVETNNLDILLQTLFKENDLLNLQQLVQNKVDILVLDKTNEVKKYLEDISRIKDYNQQVLQLFNDDSYKMKERLIEILRSVMLLDPTHNTLKIVITTLQQLGLNCQYYNDTWKYKKKAAREAYILVVDMPNGKTIIQ